MGALDGRIATLTVQTRRFGLAPRSLSPIRSISPASSIVSAAKTSDADGGPAVVMLQDLGVRPARVGHDCCADLA